MKNTTAKKTMRVEANNKCPCCGSTDVERVDTLHKCEHVTVNLYVCLQCNNDFPKIDCNN